MTIANQTNYILSVDGKTIIPDSRRYILESVFDTIGIHCDIGSAIITTEYGHRGIVTFGSLNVVESDETDREDQKILLVTDKGDENDIQRNTEND